MEKIAILGIRSCHRHLAEEEHEGNRKYKHIRKWALLVLWDREQHLPFFFNREFYNSAKILPSNIIIETPI